MYLIRVLSFFRDFQCQVYACAGWFGEGEVGLGGYQPGVYMYVPLKALVLVLFSVPPVEIEP